MINSENLNTKELPACNIPLKAMEDKMIENYYDIINNIENFFDGVMIVDEKISRYRTDCSRIRIFVSILRRLTEDGD